MKRCIRLSLGHMIRAMIAAVVLLGSVWLIEPYLDAKPVGASGLDVRNSIPNNYLFRNPSGKSATFSTQGSVALTGEYFQAQGTNGRSCAIVPHPGRGLEYQPRHAATFIRRIRWYASRLQPPRRQQPVDCEP